MGSGEQIATKSKKRKSLVTMLLVLLCSMAIGAAAFGTLILLGLGKYLSMQSLSDQVHRAAVLLMPAGLVVLAIDWMLSELGKLWTWLRWTGRVAASLASVCIFGTLVFVILFDASLESLGLEGQFVQEKSAPAALPVPAKAPSKLHGLWREESAKQPGLAIEGLSLGHVLTLDRRTIARKAPDGSFVWHVYRPGPPPAYLSADGDMLYYTGPGPDFEDDVIIMCIRLSTGAKQWIFHALGNWTSPVVSRGALISFVSARPSSSSVRLLRPSPPSLLWAVRLDGVVRILPRFTDDKLQVAMDKWLVEFDLSTGQELDRKIVCPSSMSDKKDAFGVVCKEGTVVAWRPGNSTDERPAIDIR